jgi:hypothetical protein
MKNLPFAVMLIIVSIVGTGAAPSGCSASTSPAKDVAPQPATKPATPAPKPDSVSQKPVAPAPVKQVSGHGTTTIKTPGGKEITTDANNEVMIEEDITGQVAASTQSVDNIGPAAMLPSDSKLTLDSTAAAHGEIHPSSITPPNPADTRPASVNNGGSEGDGQHTDKTTSTPMEAPPAQILIFYIIGGVILIAGIALIYPGAMPAYGLAAIGAGLVLIAIGVAVNTFPVMFFVGIGVLAIGAGAAIYLVYFHKTAATVAQSDAASKGAAATALAQAVQTHQSTGNPIDLSSVTQSAKTAIQSIEADANLRLDHSQPDPVLTPLASAVLQSAPATPTTVINHNYPPGTTPTAQAPPMPVTPMPVTPTR